MPIRREKNWKAVTAQLQTIVREAVQASARTWENELKTMLSRPGRGRYYGTTAKTRRMAVNRLTGELDHATVWFFKQLDAERVTKARERGRKAMHKNLRGLGIHRASKPGDPPAALTGHLRASIAVDDSRIKGPQPTCRIGTKASENVPYARYLEYGTRKMAKRPYFRPSTPKVAPKIKSIFRTMLSRLGRVR